MRKKKLERIKNDIILSITYSRLKEEISDTLVTNELLGDQKKRIGSNDKKIERNLNEIKLVEEAISEIKANSKGKNYSLIETNKFIDSIDLLKKRKDYQMIAYSIALEVIMDNKYKYTSNTNIDFIEGISEYLFDNKLTINNIQEKFNQISKVIYGQNIFNLLTNALTGASNLIGKMPVNTLIKNATLIPKKAYLGIAIGGATFGYTYFKLRKQAKQMSILEPGDLANKLIINAMNIYYSKMFFDKVEFNNFFRNTMKEINLERKIIMKKLFEEHYEVEANILKVKLYNHFDEHIIKEHLKKGRKKDV